MLAWLTLRLVENPVRFRPALRAGPRRAPALGLGLTAGAKAFTLLAAAFPAADPHGPAGDRAGPRAGAGVLLGGGPGLARQQPVAVIDPLPWLCSGTGDCPVVVDASHMREAYAEAIAPVLDQRLAEPFGGSEAFRRKYRKGSGTSGGCRGEDARRWAEIGSVISGTWR